MPATGAKQRYCAPNKQLGDPRRYKGRYYTGRNERTDGICRCSQGNCESSPDNACVKLLLVWEGHVAKDTLISIVILYSVDTIIP